MLGAGLSEFRTVEAWKSLGFLLGGGISESQGYPFQPASCLHHRYEDEINKRTNAENDFVVMKKVRDGGRWSSGS